LSAVALSFVLAQASYLNFGNEPFAIAYERISVALLCGSLALAHCWLLASNRLITPVALIFYPLCLALALTTSLVTRSSAKAWAPSTPNEALLANIIGYGVIASLVTAAAVTLYWSLARTKPSTA